LAKSEKGEMEKKKQNHAITPKQEKFCQEYLKCGNASEAYRLSYNISNMKPQSVNRAAKQLLDNTKIASRLKEIQAPALQKTEITLEKTLSEIARLAYSDPRKLYDENGELKPIHTLDDDTAACIGGITFDTDQQGNRYVKSIKTWDKNSALEKLGKHFKMFVERLEIDQRATVIHVHTHCPEPMPLPERLRGKND
jgi:phage terminase small subunit